MESQPFADKLPQGVVTLDGEKFRLNGDKVEKFQPDSAPVSEGSQQARVTIEYLGREEGIPNFIRSLGGNSIANQSEYSSPDFSDLFGDQTSTTEEEPIASDEEQYSVRDDAEAKQIQEEKKEARRLRRQRTAKFLGCTSVVITAVGIFGGPIIQATGRAIQHCPISNPIEDAAFPGCFGGQFKENFDMKNIGHFTLKDN